MRRSAKRAVPTGVHACFWQYAVAEETKGIFDDDAWRAPWGSKNTGRGGKHRASEKNMISMGRGVWPDGQ